jgi:2-(1,2-epoxy-1,2-dihydrophenyl)acetyl-CoA isomerase
MTDEVMARRAELAAGPTVTLGELRRLLARSGSISLREGLVAEREACVRCGETADAREGITAFVERRAPRFEGR